MIQRIPLKDLCSIDITDGTHKTPTYADSGYIFLSSKNVTSGEIDWDNVMYIPEELHKELYQRLAPQKDDILLAKNGTTGVAALVDREEIFDIYVSLALIRPDKNKIIPKYLLYAINSESSKRYFNSHLKGVGVPNLHLTHIRETPISVPDFRTQEEIIKRLDKVSDLIAKRRQQLEKLDFLVKARFVEMFGDPVTNPRGWKKQTLKDICTKLNDGTHFSPENFETGEYKYITAKNIKENGFDFSNITYVTEEVHRPIYERCNPEFGDVLYIKDGVTTGIAIINTLREEFTLLSSVALLKYKRDIINGYFLCGVLNNKEMYTSIRGNMGGAAITRLTIAKLNIIYIIVPPIELQNQFADFVEQTEKTKMSIKESLAKLETLKKALMQEYFG